ncbi:MAG TPA: D-alanyl-D-alanine carboxypeptidase/D-alanyl-D-alanine-endopeptidase [Gemmatimonadaceae bacterium]|nr:D-alanyl-D-alanine carboxypeptidase/D-alanyl-D-alanine-endopeptidase [Gemmatimonadaceae bacterium]
MLLPHPDLIRSRPAAAGPHGLARRSRALVWLSCALLALPAGSEAQTRPLAGAITAATASGEGASAAEQTRGKRRETPQRRSRASGRRTRARSTAVPAAPRWTTPRGTTALASDLGTMIGSRTRGGQWGAIVVSLTRGDTLYSINADLSLQPASNMKLFTAALALDQLGPAHEFRTDVLRDGSLAPDGTLRGNLILRGDGDPGFSSRFFGGGPSSPVDSLAARVAAAGIRQVQGDIIADASAFGGQRIPDGWQARYLQASYAARVSALSINDNLGWVVVRPGATKSPAVVSIEPAAELPVVNKARTVAGSGARLVILPTQDGGLEVRGWIGRGAAEKRYSFVIEEPALFTASALRHALAARGVTVTGAVRLGATPSGAVRVASLPSQPLSRLLSVMNRESVNHYAELLFRDAAREAAPDGVGTVEAGGKLLERFMTEKVGAAPGSVSAADGSGLSVLDRVTPRALVQLLAYGHQAPWADAFHASLPVAGESELLRNRMRYTPAQGNLHAKTGTTNTVISLGGYVTSEDGELLAFAFIYNGSDRWNARTTIDTMGATLAGFTR